MKFQLFLTIVGILGVEHLPLSYGLQCYTCSNCPGSAGIQDSPVLKNCTNGENYCIKGVGSYNGVAIVIKGCYSTCLTGTQTVGTLTGTTYCCSTDGCNHSFKTYANVYAILLSCIITSFFGFKLF